jgi:hypothetical protein
MTANCMAGSDQRLHKAVHDPGSFLIKHYDANDQRFATQMGVDVYYILPDPIGMSSVMTDVAG